jgi:GNAT superfamily N-acetyltransferase
MSDVSVRPARLGDVAPLTAVQLRSWESSSLPGTPDPSDVERAWERATLLPPSPRHRLLVALDGDDVVGAVATVPAPDPDLDAASDSELVLLAVDPGRRRRGHGSRMLAAAVDLMRSSGDTLAVVWVPARDDATRQFLESTGWAPDGAHRTTSVDDDTAPVRWLRLATDLREAPA